MTDPLERSLAEHTAGWPAERKADLLLYLQAQHARESARRRYDHPAQLAAALDPAYVVTPAIDYISRSIERVIREPRRNLLVTMPPQEGKSSLCAVWAPIRALQLNPDTRIIIATYGDSLAEEHSAAARDVIQSHGTGATDSITGKAVEDRLGLRLRADSTKVSRWRVEGGRGGVVAAGLGSSITGKAADLLIIDDPFKNMQEADSASHRRKVMEWFRAVALTRLAPNASIVLIQCMTGDTPVLRPDGTETALRDIRPGDRIATYENGGIAESTVRNHANQGPDVILTICLKSGRKLRANARHPFLVTDGKVETWTRAGELRPGQSLTATESGSARAAWTGATPRQCARVCAASTTGGSDGPTGTARRPVTRTATASGTCATDTESGMTSTPPCWTSKAGVVPCAGDCRSQVSTCLSIGTVSSAWTTTMTQAKSEGYCVTTATSCSNEERIPRDSGQPLTTWTVTRDEVVSVTVSGVEDVYDIQVDRTENFIANGVVSHNTRWHPEDLAGQVIAAEAAAEPAQRTWRHLNIPAVAEDGVPDALGRAPGTAMVSARGRTADDFAATRRSVGERVWYALYQGVPAPVEGGLFARDWFSAHRLDALDERPVATVVGIDPAETGEDDEAGIVAAALLPDGTVALTHDWSGSMTSDQWARTAIRLAMETGAREVAYEAYSTPTTYKRVLSETYTAMRAEARENKRAGMTLSRSDERLVKSATMPFRIHPWRGKGDAVARSGLLRRDLEVGKARVVGAAMAVMEEQAREWQVGQHQPDRIAAAIIAHDRARSLASSAGGQYAAPRGTLRAVPGGRAPAGRAPSVMSRRLG